MIFRVHVPAGSSPHVWTDMKSQFLKPLDDVSLSRSARSTVVVPEGRTQMGWIHLPPKILTCLSIACSHGRFLTSWGGECDVQVSSPGVFDAGFHLYMFQWADSVLLARTSFGWNLYGDLPCCFQIPVGSIKIAVKVSLTSSWKQQKVGHMSTIIAEW